MTTERKGSAKGSAKPTGSGSKHRRKNRHLLNGRIGDLDHGEIVAAVCQFVASGMPVSEVAAEVEKHFGVPLTRKDPFRFFRYAARHHMISFVPPYEFALAQRMEEKYAWLDVVKVVHTSVFDDVAARGAEVLLHMVQQRAASKDEVHIGLAGGQAMRKLAQHFARLLQLHHDPMPRKLWFHAMVSGFDVHDPSTDPNAFFIYFLPNPAFEVETGFVLLRAPCLVESSAFTKIKNWQGVREAYLDADKIDIVCTSGSSWKDEHSQLMYYMKKSEKSLEALKKAGCVGDMLWQPLGARGPITIPTDIRAMTLMDLGELSHRIQQKMQVLMVLGPCNTCHRPKTDILGTILNAEIPLVSHLIIDSLTARAIVGSR